MLNLQIFLKITNATPIHKHLLVASTMRVHKVSMHGVDLRNHITGALTLGGLQHRVNKTQKNRLRHVLLKKKPVSCFANKCLTFPTRRCLFLYFLFQKDKLHRYLEFSNIQIMVFVKTVHKVSCLDKSIDDYNFDELVLDYQWWCYQDGLFCMCLHQIPVTAGMWQV